MDSDIRGHLPCDTKRTNGGYAHLLSVIITSNQLVRLVQALESGQKWEEAGRDQEIFTGMKEWVGEDEGQYMVAIRRRQPLCSSSKKHGLPPQTQHLPSHLPQFNHNTPETKWTLLFNSMTVLDAGLPACVAKREILFMFEYGPPYLVYFSALWRCTEPLNKYSSHFSYLPPQGFLYPAQLTAGVLTKPTLLQFR